MPASDRFPQDEEYTKDERSWPAATGPARTETFFALDQTLTEPGASAAIDLLVIGLDERGDPRRCSTSSCSRPASDLGLPLVQAGSLTEEIARRL